MTKADKRARKKEHRDAALADRWTAYRRRRNARLIGVGLVALVVVGLAVLSSNERDGKQEPGAAATTASALPEQCRAAAPPPAEPAQYRKAEQVLEEGVDYHAVIETSCGDLNIDLLEDDAPITVNNFVFLAEQGFYNGLTWHRIEPNFVIQGGDPNGQNGQEPDGPGYSIKDEFPETGADYVYGVVAMANSGQPDSGGSQFFVVTHRGPKGGDEPAGLEPAYSIFGKVDEASFAVLDILAKLETKGGDDPIEAVKPVAPVYINKIEVVER